MKARKVIILVYHFPPLVSGGGSRWTAMRRHLRAFGYDVTVVTTGAYGRLPTLDENGVVRTGDLVGSKALRSVLRRPPLVAGGLGPGSEDRPPVPLLTRIAVPDAYLLSWIPAAVNALRGILRHERFDCLVTSSPPESAHLAGLALGRRRPPWVADLRDGWSFEPLRGQFPTSRQRRLDAWLEGRVVSEAEVVVSATTPIAEDLRRRLGVPAAVVPNGWDPHLDEELSGVEAPALEPGTMNLVHTGSLRVGARDPQPLFDALLHLATEDFEAIRRLRLVLAGRLTPEDQRLLSRPQLQPLVRHVGVVPRPMALALQRAAGGLLLITSRQSGEATGKLFEYLAARRPILALAEGNAAAQIVQEARAGITVAPHDVSEIAKALRLACNGGLERAFEPREVERYRYPAPAEAMAEAIERAVATRAR